MVVIASRNCERNASTSATSGLNTAPQWTLLLCDSAGPLNSSKVRRLRLWDFSEGLILISWAKRKRVRNWVPPRVVAHKARE